MASISINSDLSIESDHQISNTEQQYINLLKFVLKDINFNKFTLITDDVALDNDISGNDIIGNDISGNDIETNGETLLALTTTKNSKKYKLCSIWGLMLHKKIGDLLESSNQRLWSSKTAAAIWRGSTTGQDYLIANKETRKYTRFNLVSKASSRPDLIDAGFTSIVQYASKNKQKFDLIMKKQMNQEEQSMYKYIVVADGNSGTYSYYWVLASGSVPLKQESEYVQYFEEKLQEYVHYVPIKRDFSDLFEKIMWLRLNDSKAQEIANNAMKFAKEHFNIQLLKEQIIKCINDK